MNLLFVQLGFCDTVQERAKISDNIHKSYAAALLGSLGMI